MKILLASIVTGVVVGWFIGSIAAAIVSSVILWILFWWLPSFKKVTEERIEKADDWSLSTKDCQFKHFYNGSRIALDTNNMIIYLSQNGIQRSYPFSDIRYFEYFYRKDLGGSSFRQLISHRAESGFFVTVRDIDYPKWRIEFPYNKEIEKNLLRWMEIFRQHVNNE